MLLAASRMSTAFVPAAKFAARASSSTAHRMASDSDFDDYKAEVSSVIRVL